MGAGLRAAAVLVRPAALRRAGAGWGAGAPGGGSGAGAPGTPGAARFAAPEALQQAAPPGARLPEGEDGRTTRADRAGDRGTPLRRLDEPLCLVVRGTPGGRWEFPALEHAPGGAGGAGGAGALRGTAEQALAPFVEAQGRVQFVGNAPAAVMGAGGGVGQPGTFLFVAKLLGGAVDTAGVAEAHWVSRDEVGEYFPDAADRSLLEAVLPCAADGP